jgi:hypothetical protein
VASLGVLQHDTFSRLPIARRRVQWQNRPASGASRRIKAPFFEATIQFSLQFVLNSYCARLSGLGSPPLVNFSGWTRPLGKNFLISTQSKVLFQ